MKPLSQTIDMHRTDHLHIVLSAEGQVWINDSVQCLLRVGKVFDVIIEDNRPKKRRLTKKMKEAGATKRKQEEAEAPKCPKHPNDPMERFPGGTYRCSHVHTHFVDEYPAEQTRCTYHFTPNQEKPTTIEDLGKPAPFVRTGNPNDGVLPPPPPMILCGACGGPLGDILLRRLNQGIECICPECRGVLVSADLKEVP